MWSPLKESRFDLCDSSMSAAVQELYAGLPVALSAERSALSDPTIVLDAEPEAPAFVLSCRSGLPSEHQRTYELKLCSQDSHERPNYVGQMPGPRLVKLLSKEPAGTVVLAGNEEAQDGNSAEQDCLPGRLTEDAEAAESPRGVAEEGLGCLAPASRATCWSEEGEPQLIQEGRECLPRPSHAESAGSLQSLEESQANVQVAVENLPNPTKEVPGRKADRTVLFGKAGESCPYGSLGVPPGTGECSEVETVMAEVGVSETSTLVSLEPVSVADDALVKEGLQGEEERQGPRAATTSALSVSEAGEEKPLNQNQEVGATLDHVLPSHQDKMNLHDHSRLASELETRDTIPEMSNCLFQGGLELGQMLWEEDTDVFEVVCETQEESSLGDDRCSGDIASWDNTALLEEWASLMSTGERLLATCSRVELSSDSDTEQETRNRVDHSYSCICGGNVQTEKGNRMQSCWKETQTSSHSGNGQQELQVCPFSKEQNTPSQPNTSFLLEVGRSALEGHSDDDLKSVFSGSDSVQRDELQQYSLSKDGSLASVLEGNASLWKEAGSSMRSQSGCNASTPPHPTCCAPFNSGWKSREEPLRQVVSASNQRTEMSSSAMSLHAVNFICTADVHLVSDEENPAIAQPGNDHSFPPEKSVISSPGGFLDSLPKEDISGTCAELGRRGAACLLCDEEGLSSARQNSGGCSDRSREPQHSAAPKLCNVEERTAEMPSVESKACIPKEQCVNSLCSATEGYWTISGSVCLSDCALKMRTETIAEQVDGLEVCHAPASPKTAGPPQERSGLGAQDFPSYENNQNELGRGESSSASLCSLRTSSASLLGAEALESDAEVEGQRLASDSCMSAEEMLDVDTHVGPPDTNLEVISAFSMTGPGGLETVESGTVEEDSHRSGASETRRDSGCVDETVHPLEPGRLVKEQGTESQAPAHHYNHPVSWNQESEGPEREVLEDQQQLWIISGWRERDSAVQAVTRSDIETQESASHSQNESLCLQGDGIVTPPGLVTPNDVQQTSQQIVTGSYFSMETALGSVSNPLKREPVELKNPEPSAECVFERLEWNGFAKERTDEVKMGEFCSASVSVKTSLSDTQEKNHSLKFNSESSSPSNQDYLHPAPNPLAVASGQNSTEGASSRLCQNKKLSRLLCLGAQPAQNPGTSLSQKDDPSASPYPNVLCCPLAQEYPVPTVFQREDDRHISSLNDKGSHPPQVGACVGSPPPSKEIPSSMMGSKAGTVILGEIVYVTPSNVDPSRKIKPSLEDHPREGSQTVENLPVCSFSNAVDTSGPLEDVRGHAWQSKGLLLTGLPGVLHNTVPWASRGGGVSEASPKCFRSQGRHWQSTKRSQELAGVRRKAFPHAVNKGTEVHVGNMRVSETGDCPELAVKAVRKEARGCPYRSVSSCDGLRAKATVKAEHVLKKRLLRVWQPLGSSLRGLAVKPQVPARQTFAAGCITEGRKSKSTWSNLQELKRPKISKDLFELDCLEGGSLRLSDENCGWMSTDSNMPLAPVSFTWPQAVGSGRHGIRSAFGSAHKTQQSLPFSRPSGKVQGKLSGPVQFQAARKSNPVRSSVCLKNLLEVFPQHKSQLVDCVYPAMRGEAIRKAGTILWSQAPKRRASQSSLLGHVGFGQLTQDQAVLWRLSVLADKLLTPPRNPQQWKLPWQSTKRLALTGQCCPLPSWKLLDVFSCVNLKFRWMNDSSCCPKMLNSPSLALFPIESLNLCFWDLGHKVPLSFSAPLFPVSLHIKVGPFPARSLLGIPSLVTGERDITAKPLRWMLSFLFPRSCLCAAPVEESAPIGSSLHAKKDRGEDGTAQRRSGCPPQGLQTILALSSARCYRLWTRKRHLTSRRTPATQKLTVLQFVQGLKGLNCSSLASSDFFYSVPHSVGRGLSLWSQHGPSTYPSEFPPLHSNHCTWQPITPAATSLGLRNSPTVLPQVPDQILGAPWVVASAVRADPPFPASLPTRCSVSEPVLSSLGLSAPEFQVHPLDDLDVSLPVLPKTGHCLDKADSEKRPKKVSQIRIRKTIPKPDPNLTPMGLPRPKRLKKKEFSLEEIYTNKNYKSPPTTRCLETIFEEPKEKNGSLISISQQKRKRILEFQDFTIPRKRRVRSRVKVLGSFTRAQKAALEGRELDVLLIQKLTDLETFFAKEEEKEQAASS
ncbi:protein PRR14L [Tiliqua scincoides]|uniref:protein PRR14L n=1 Tax=Tiliqua scincoides TaxID=71010 RepID=UPI003461BBAE